jgi:hypothetical protein
VSAVSAQNREAGPEALSTVSLPIIYGQTARLSMLGLYADLPFMHLFELIRAPPTRTRMRRRGGSANSSLLRADFSADLRTGTDLAACRAPLPSG